MNTNFQKEYEDIVKTTNTVFENAVENLIDLAKESSITYGGATRLLRSYRKNENWSGSIISKELLNTALHKLETEKDSLPVRKKINASERNEFTLDATNPIDEIAKNLRETLSNSPGF